MKKSILAILMIVLALFAFIACEPDPAPDKSDTETVAPDQGKPDAGKPDTGKPDAGDTEKEEPEDPVIEVSVAATVIDTDTLPALEVTTDVEGTIKWDDGQTVKKGFIAYNWTFTPKDTAKWNVKKGSTMITKVDKFSDEVKTFDKTEIDSWEDGKTYFYVNATFPSINTSSQIDITFIDCTFKAGNTGDGGSKCIYMTNPTDLTISGCTFEGKTTAGSKSTTGYALDLNLFGKDENAPDLKKVRIENCTFNTTTDGGQNVAISIKTRKGENDLAKDIPEGAKAIKIVEGVDVSGCKFNNGSGIIYKGTNPKSGDPEEDNSCRPESGNYELHLSGNDALTVYRRNEVKKGENMEGHKVSVAKDETVTIPAMDTP